MEWASANMSDEQALLGRCYGEARGMLGPWASDIAVWELALDLYNRMKEHETAGSCVMMPRL